MHPKKFVEKLIRNFGKIGKIFPGNLKKILRNFGEKVINFR